MQKLAKVLLVDDDATTNFLHTRLLTRLEVAEELSRAKRLGSVADLGTDL